MAVETLEGRIRKIKYHDVGARSRSGVPYLIAELNTGATVKGEMKSPRYDETYRFVGMWRPQKGPYGDAFEFEAYDEIVEQSESGIAQYLSRKVDGLGSKKSAAIVEAFGVDTLRTLQAKPEMALQVRGITEKNVEAIATFFRENRRADPAAVARVLEMFAGHRFPKKLAETFVTDFGSDAPKLLAENPYLLLAYPRVGWETCDPFALRQGYAPDGVERHKAAILEAFARHSNEGHTVSTKGEIEDIAYGLLNGRASDAAWVSLIMAGEIVSLGLEATQGGVMVDEDSDLRVEVVRHLDAASSPFALPKVHAAEESIARQIALLASAARPLPFEIATDGLNDEQAAAVNGIAENGVFLLMGAPGTGKSYTVSRVVKGLIDHGYSSIRVVAPTGKAAKRSDELIRAALARQQDGVEVQCSTIHRALEPRPSQAPLGVPADTAKINRGREAFGFARNESHPLEAELVIVDETSMADVKLFDCLLRAIRPGARLILVGDINQLPSVGPGSVLRDLRDGGLASVELSRIVRSDGGGRVVRACHAIKEGRVPEPAEDLNPPTENWIHVERVEPYEILETIVELNESIRRNGNYDPYWDVQVVAAQYERPGIGCSDLNRALSDLLNDQAAQDEDDGTGRRPDFRIGDKVVRTENGTVDQLIEIASKPAATQPEADDEDDDLCLDRYLAQSLLGSPAKRVDWRWAGKSWSIEETDVVNGDMGLVEDIVTEGKQTYVVCRFRNPDRLCRLPYADASIQAAFAMTCHKAQGSGFPVVIVPVHLSYYWNSRTQTGLFSREWFYTAISRAERVLITVGPWAAVEAVVGRKTIGYRKTTLAGRIRRAFEGMAAGYEAK